MNQPAAVRATRGGGLHWYKYSGQWFLTNDTEFSNQPGAPLIVISFGSPGDQPVAGDWDGDGDDTPGVFRSGRWYELDSLRSGIADREGSFGSAGDIAVPGDWDRDHDDSPGVFRPSTGTWYLTTDLGKPAGAAFRYGDRTYAPLPVSW